MSNSTFQFKSTSDSPARFEFVDIIKNTPRNPQDYADLQSIIRFRLASMVSELFGNCRISQVTGPFTVETVETVKYFKADGIWYIDGYRIELNDVIASNSVSNTNDYCIWFGFEFADVSTDIYNGGVMHDTFTGSLIETSKRVIMDVGVAVSASSDVVPSELDEYAYKYYIADAHWDAENVTWTFDESSSFKLINQKYSDALDNISRAVSKLALDDKTVEIGRLVTDNTTAKAKLLFEQVTNEKLMFGFTNDSGKLLGALEIVKENDEWNPVLWMKEDTTGYPLSYMTPDGFSVFDNKGQVGRFDNKSIAFGNNTTGFSANNKEIKYTTSGKKGFHVKREVNESSQKLLDVTPDEGNIVATPDDPIYETGSSFATYNTGNPVSADTTAIYTFVFTEIPNDRHFQVNHRLALADNCLTSGFVKVDVHVKSGTDTYTFVDTQKYLLKPGDVIVDDPFLIALPRKFDIDKDANNATVKLTYSLETFTADYNIAAEVGFKHDENISYELVADMSVVTEVDVLRINDHVLYVDDNGKLRMKELSNLTNPAAEVALLKDSTKGYSEGIRTVGGATSVIVDYNSTDIPEPIYEDENFVFPVVDKIAAATGAGLMSKEAYNTLLSLEGSFSSLAVANRYPRNTVFVSNQWRNDLDYDAVTNNFPYFSDIQSAINWIQNPVANNGGGSDSASGTATDSSGAVIILYPGEYGSGTQEIKLVPYSYSLNKPIAIVAPWRGTTKITATIKDGEQAATAFIDVPVEPTGGVRALISGNSGSNIVFGPNATITAGINNTNGLIAINSADTVHFYGSISHLGTATGQNGIIQIGYNGTGNVNVHFHNIITHTGGCLFNISSGNVYLHSQVVSTETSTNYQSNALFYINNNVAKAVNLYINEDIIMSNLQFIYSTSTQSSANVNIKVKGDVTANFSADTAFVNLIKTKLEFSGHLKNTNTIYTDNKSVFAVGDLSRLITRNTLLEVAYGSIISLSGNTPGMLVTNSTLITKNDAIGTYSIKNSGTNSLLAATYSQGSHPVSAGSATLVGLFTENPSLRVFVF